MLTKEEREDFESQREYSKANHLVYAPNSIFHGFKIFRRGGPSLSKEQLLQIEVHRLHDFIGFLFEHSEHCNHISESDAWKEFDEFEYENKLRSEAINSAPQAPI
jgi:hypothetical protein